MEYKIKKAPPELLRGNVKKTDFPLAELKVGEMFEAHISKKNSIYNAIKHRRNYTKEFEGLVFSVKTISQDKIVCVRIK